MPCEHARDDRISLDLLEQRMKRRPRLSQVLARSRPLRYYGSEKIDRAQFRATEIRTRREEIGEHFPMLVQPRARAGADAILHGGARGLGILMGATGVGALLGALTLAGRSGVRGLGNLVAGAAAGFGATLMLFSFSRWFRLSAVILVATGFCMMLQMACTNTLLQSMVPDRLRGRVMALYSMMFMGMAPFGALYAGLTASQIGAPLTVAAGAAGCLLAAAVFASRVPGLRGQARQLILAQGIVGSEPPEEMTARGITGNPASE